MDGRRGDPSLPENSSKKLVVTEIRFTYPRRLICARPG